MNQIRQRVQSLIYRYWVDPLQRQVHDLAATKSGWSQQILLPATLWGVNVGRLAITAFRVYVRRLSGPDWSAIYIGDGRSFEEIRHILFPRASEVETSSRVFLWQIPALAKKCANQAELVVCELNPAIRWRPRGNYVFTVPIWIRQVLDVMQPMGAILAGMNQNIRRSLRKMEKQGFDYVFTKQQQDFDVFYHKMYRPYIHSRHGERSVTLAAYDSLCRQFNRGGLILVRRNLEPVCGMLCRPAGDTWEADQMGVHEKHFDQVREGANVALWWFMMDWARRGGWRYFDFGASRAVIANGVFNFKRQWGTRVVSQRDIESEWVFYGEQLSPRLRCHLNEQGLISEMNNLHYRLVLVGSGEHLSDAELARKHEDALHYGLDGVWLISPQFNSRPMLSTHVSIAEAP